jgi:RNA polymerase sigma-70 factor, ECF subfamily
MHFALSSVHSSFSSYTLSMPEHLTDAELVEKALENPDSYGMIIERFEFPLTRYIIRITRAEHEEVEDILQSVFIKAYRSLNGFDTKLKLSSWMYRIAHNACVDFCEKIPSGSMRASMPTMNIVSRSWN